MRALLVLVLCSGTAVAFGQDNFPDVPEHHWVYEWMAKMVRRGVGDNPWLGLRSGPRTLERKQIAAWLSATFSRLPEFVRDYTDKVREDATSDRPWKAHELLLALEQSPRLLKTFAPELEAHGTTVTDLVKIAKESATDLRALWKDPKAGPKMPFLDVPFEHWAYHATSELKYLGLLRGYPSAQFGSPRR